MKISNELTGCYTYHDIRFLPRGIINSERTGQAHIPVLDIKPCIKSGEIGMHMEDITRWNETPKELRYCL